MGVDVATASATVNGTLSIDPSPLSDGLPRDDRRTTHDWLPVALTRTNDLPSISVMQAFDRVGPRRPWVPGSAMAAR